MISFFRNLFAKQPSSKKSSDKQDLLTREKDHDLTLDLSIFKVSLELVVRRECLEMEDERPSTHDSKDKPKKLRRKTTIIEKHDQAITTYNDRNEFTRIPLIAYHCFERLEKFVDKEGIFRVPGSSVEIDKIVKDVDSGIVVNLKTYSCNTVASLLKKYIRELPDPLLTYEGYNDWTKLSSMENTEQAREFMKKLFIALPPCNRSLFISLLSLLRKISEPPNIETSRMTESNLAFIWGMNILKPPGSDLMRSDISKVSHAIIFCIKEYHMLREVYQQLVNEHVFDSTSINTSH